MGNKAANAIAEDEEEFDVEDQLDAELDQEDDDDLTETVILSEDDDDDEIDVVSTAEINVEKLIAEVSKCDEKDAARKSEVRRRLEELAESRSMEDTFAMDFGDD